MSLRHRAVVGVLCLALAPACSRHEPGPSVLLVTVDTLRADHLGTYGFPFDTSPSLDALAREGVVFERAIAAASETAPSHASIMTSRRVREHAVGHGNGDTRLASEPTLAEAFRDAGYATAAFVGNLMLVEKLGFSRGFDLYDDDLTEPERNRPFVLERSAERTSERALAWLAEQGERPVFLWVHYQDPHGPYTPPDDLAGRFAIPPEPGEEPLPVHDTNSGFRGVPAYQKLDDARLPSEYRGRYAGEIFYADRWIGRLIAAMEARPGGERTVIAVTADHGEAFGENETWFNHAHATTPDVAWVPFVLRAPGLAPGRRPEPVHHVDVMPTLLELAGVDAPDGLRGVALGPVLRGEASLPDRWLYCDDGDRVSAYRGEAFLRGRSADSAWSGKRTTPRWTPYRWERDGRWSRVAGEATVPPEVQDYVGSAVPMESLGPPTEEEIEFLRALGYVEN